MNYLVDTNVLINLFKPEPEKNTKDFQYQGLAVINPWL